MNEENPYLYEEDQNDEIKIEELDIDPDDNICDVSF